VLEQLLCFNARVRAAGLRYTGLMVGGGRH